jgi:hypothetical protein
MTHTADQMLAQELAVRNIVRVVPSAPELRQDLIEAGAAGDDLLCHDRALCQSLGLPKVQSAHCAFRGIRSLPRCQRGQQKQDETHKAARYRGSQISIHPPWHLFLQLVLALQHVVHEK